MRFFDKCLKLYNESGPKIEEKKNKLVKKKIAEVKSEIYKRAKQGYKCTFVSSYLEKKYVELIKEALSKEGFICTPPYPCNGRYDFTIELFERK